MDFYDGGKYFTCNLPPITWGLFTSIINLPPTYRDKVGISTFLSDIHWGFSDLYWEELITLFEALYAPEQGDEEGKEDYFDQEYKMEYEIEYDEME